MPESTKPVTFRLGESDHATLQEMAKDGNTTISRLVSRAVHEFLNRNQDLPTSEPGICIGSEDIQSIYPAMQALTKPVPLRLFAQLVIAQRDK